MTLLIEPKLMSIEQFDAMPHKAGYELVDGVLTKRKTIGAEADYVAQQVSFEWVGYCRAHDAGYVFGSETVYRCFGNRNTGRRGDASFIAKDRLPGGQIPPGFLTIPADVILEVISPNDKAYKVEEKVDLYRRHGFGEVWVIYPNVRTVRVYRKDEPHLSFNAEQTLTGRGALEGFACPVSRLFPVAAAAPATS